MLPFERELSRTQRALWKFELEAQESDGMWEDNSGYCAVDFTLIAEGELGERWATYLLAIARASLHTSDPKVFDAIRTIQVFSDEVVPLELYLRDREEALKDLHENHHKEFESISPEIAQAINDQGYTMEDLTNDLRMVTVMFQYWDELFDREDLARAKSTLPKLLQKRDDPQRAAEIAETVDQEHLGELLALYYAAYLRKWPAAANAFYARFSKLANVPLGYEENDEDVD